MIGVLTTKDKNEEQVTKDFLHFVHFKNQEEDDIKQECAKVARDFANKVDASKVFLFYGKDKKIIYDYSL